MLKKYFYLFVFCIFVFFTHAIVTKHAIYGDGNGYYVYTQSILFDQSLNSNSIYNHLQNFKGKEYTFSRIFWDKNANPFTIGTSLFWIPMTSVFSIFADRFDLTMELAPGITGIFLMLTGLYFLELFLKYHFSPNVSQYTILGIFFGSNILYYSSFEPSLSHQPGFFLICLLLLWTSKFKNNFVNLFYLGLLSGLLAIVRMADVIFLIPIYILARIKLNNTVPIAFGILVGLLPQLINQYISYGSPFVNLYLSGNAGSWNFSVYRILEYLFSPRRGLILWTPIILVSFLGLIRAKSFIILATIVLHLAIVSSWSAYLSAGFGQRLSFSAIPFFAIGIAHIIKNANRLIVVGIFGFCLFWNLMLIKNIYLHKNLFIQSESFSINQFLSYMVRFN